MKQKCPLILDETRLRHDEAANALVREPYGEVRIVRQ